MEITKIKIKDPGGLHLRPAAKIVTCARKYKSKTVVCHDCKFADSCSIVDLVSLGAGNGSDIAVIAQGPDEKQVIQEITELFKEGAGI